MKPFLLRFGYPVALVSLCFACLCAVTAFSLFAQQASVSATLRENVASQRAATELEECLLDMVSLLAAFKEDGAEQLHARLNKHAAQLRTLADQPEEQGLATRLEVGLKEYQRRWKTLPSPDDPSHKTDLQAVVRFLESNLLKPCQEFQAYNTRRIEESTEQHQSILQRLAWGMASVGVLGAAAGLFLGYGVSRAVHTSIRQLAVRIRAAAGMMREEAPEIVLTTGEGDFQGLHDQVDRLTGSIERVVQELQQRQREVLRAEQLAAVGQLAAGVAHEIRNPLTSIKMLVQAGLEDGGMPVEDLRVIEPEVRRMERSLQTFLDFARPPQTERRPTNLHALVRQVADLLHGRATKQGVTLENRLPVGETVLVVDGQQLEQVLVNLALNALDAMPNGGRIAITVRAEADGGATLEVADTGPGFSSEMQSKLFQPFASSKPTGMGLGLVISRRIVEDHGGTLNAANGPEGGAVFTVRLPCREDAACHPS